MSRPPREFKPGSFELEGRLLLAVGFVSLAPRSRDTVGFAGIAMLGQPQVALQQDGTATVSLYRSAFQRGGTPVAPIQVVVATDPSSPAVGVNVGAVHQTVTFDGNNPNPSVTVPILSGAPNPGEVDVTLTITPIDPPPDLRVGPPLDLRILASKDMLPPSIEDTWATPQGIALKFSKPMDPAGVSNVKNYAVRAMSSGWGGIGSYSVSSLFTSIFTSIFGDHSSHSSPPPVRIVSAQYDAATQTVTLVPARKLNYKAYTYNVRLVRQPKLSSLPGPHSNLASGITDLRGQTIDTGLDYSVNPPV
jgi:hypothetical protein